MILRIEVALNGLDIGLRVFLTLCTITCSDINIFTFPHLVIHCMFQMLKIMIPTMVLNVILVADSKLEGA